MIINIILWSIWAVAVLYLLFALVIALKGKEQDEIYN